MRSEVVPPLRKKLFLFLSCKLLVCGRPRTGGGEVTLGLRLRRARPGVTGTRGFTSREPGPGYSYHARGPWGYNHLDPKMDSEPGWVLVRRHPTRYWTSLQRLAGFLHQLSTCLAPAARPQPCYMHACKLELPHPGHRPRASPGSARPEVGITPSFTADGVVDLCSLDSEAG